MADTTTPRTRDLLTVGELSRRTGIPIKAVRDYTDHGLVYTQGRSPAGYRTYTSEALSCLHLITTLRGLGLTLAEIRGLTRAHLQPPGLRLAWLLAASRQRTNARIAALQATLARIDTYEHDHHAELTGQRPLWGHDERSQPEKCLTLTPGSGPTFAHINPTTNGEGHEIPITHTSNWSPRPAPAGCPACTCSPITPAT